MLFSDNKSDYFSKATINIRILDGSGIGSISFCGPIGMLDPS